MLEHAHKMIQHTTTIIIYSRNADHYLSLNKWVHYPLVSNKAVVSNKAAVSKFSKDSYSLHESTKTVKKLIK